MISLNSEISIWFFFIVYIFLLRFTIFSLIKSVFSSKSLKVETCLLIQISESSESERGESHSVMFNSLQPQGLYNPWNSSGQNTGMG